MKTLKTTLWLALVALLASPVSAAIVYLKDGTQIQGTVVDATANDVVIHTADGTRRVSSDKIARIDYAQTGAPAMAAPAAAGGGSEWGRLQSSGFDVRKQMVSLGLGLAVPLNDADIKSIDGGTSGGTNGTIGPLVRIEYLYYQYPQAAFGGSFDYFHRSADGRTGPVSTNNLQLTNMEVSGDSVLFQAIAKYTFTDHGRTRPYVRGGIGFHHSWTDIEARPQSGFAWSDTGTSEHRTVINGAATGLAGSLSVGLDFNYGAPSNFGVELGWLGLSSETYGTTAFGDSLGLQGFSGPIQVFSFLGRWGWSF